MTYIVALIDGDTRNYGVSFPDLPGCVAAGDTLDDALASAAEVLAFHLEDMAKEGLAIPAPRTLDAMKADPEFALEFSRPHAVALVPFEPARKSIRIKSKRGIATPRPDLELVERRLKNAEADYAERMRLERKP